MHVRACVYACVWRGRVMCSTRMLVPADGRKPWKSLGQELELLLVA